MLLAIDIGNTNIVCAVYNGNQQMHKWRHHSHDTIENIFDAVEFKIDFVIVGSVVPKINDDLIKLCHTKFNINPLFITHENIGIQTNLDNPHEVGADRIINAVAVLAYYNKPAIIVDFGTATTFDVIDKKGTYAGGVIAPGINLSLKALGDAAAQLPQLKIEKPAHIIGKNTIDAMQSGIYWGYIGLIEGTIKRIKEEIGDDCIIIATGGLAPLFAEGTDLIKEIDSDLTLKGLVELYKTLITN